MKHLDLFSGIGGFALAADRVFGDVEHTFCEIDPFCQEVLKKHWPQATIYGDIRTLTANTRCEPTHNQTNQQELEGQGSDKFCFKQSRTMGEVDILTGGFPCQPFSQAGRRKGTADDRYLWPEMLRVIREFHPSWIIGENVGGLVTWNEGMVLEQVHADLEGEGYEVQSFIIPAVSVNAPHRRDRVWIIAHSSSYGHYSFESRIDNRNTKQKQTRSEEIWFTSKRNNDASDTERQGHEGQVNQAGQSAGHNRGTQSPDWSTNWIEVAQRFCQLDDGIPYRLAGFGLNETCAIMGYILLLRDNFYGTKKSTRTEEILSALQKATTPQAFSELLRGYGEVQKEEILRCSVHGESNDERESKPWSLLSKSEKTERKEMRKLWHDKLAEYPPYQRGLDGQCSCQFDDIVRELSSPIALAEWQKNAKETTDILFSMWEKSGGAGILHEPLQALQEIWESLTDKEIGSFRRHYYLRNDNRNPRLKALGNAIVPQVAEEIMKAINQLN